MRTVDAMDWVDLRSDRWAAKALLFSSSALRSARRGRTTNHQIRNRMAARASRPPTTPPAIAPTLGPLDGCGWPVLVPSDIHLVVAQESQVWLVMVHIVPAGHAGQVGAEVPHCLQRLKRERAGEKPASGAKARGSRGSRSMVGSINKATGQRYRRMCR